jgi:uncharacterized protein YicC (UPF0701 family)
MTGFGRAEQTVGDKTFLVDIKSLNGKQFDLQLKMPAFLKPFEFDIRKMLSEKLGRGRWIAPSALKKPAMQNRLPSTPTWQKLTTSRWQHCHMNWALIRPRC